jgi:hypothetical protein
MIGFEIDPAMKTGATGATDVQIDENVNRMEVVCLDGLLLVW